MVDEVTLAKELYTRYCESVGGKDFNGDPLPSADEFFGDESKSKQVNAWLAVANRAKGILIDGAW